MTNGPEDLEAMGVSPEEMKTPEQREREMQIVIKLVYMRIGQPAEGREKYAANIAADVNESLSDEKVAIPENINLSPDEDRLILCTLSNMEIEKTPENIEAFMSEIVEKELYNFHITLEQSRRDELVNIAIIFKAISDRVERGIDQTVFTEEEIDQDEIGEYPYEEQDVE